MRERGLVRRSFSEGGFTLVEILVALTLLLIGIYAALRIFPVGFRVTESSQNRIWAANLARAELERVKLAGGSLPDAIIVTDPFGNLVDRDFFNSITEDYDPYDLTPRVQPQSDPTLIKPNPGWEPDGAYLPRLIIGETVTIPPAGKTGGGLVPIHLLNFAPIDYLKYDANSGEHTGDPVQIRSTLYQPVDNRYLLADLRECSNHYYVDYSRGEIYFRACSRDRHVAIEYTYVGANGDSHDVFFQQTDIAAGPAPGRLWTVPYNVPAPPNGWQSGDRVVRGSVRVYDVFQFVGFVPLGGVAPQLDAGEFMMEQLDDGNGNWVSAAGKIFFSTGDAGRTVKIDYRVRDWGIVREDRRVEGTKITLSVPFVAGDETYANQPRTANPVAVNPGNGTPAYIVAVRLDNGFTLYPGTHFKVDSRTGELFEFDANEAPPGTEVRVLYRTEAHWTVQVMKPASVYYRDPGTGRESWPGYQYFLWRLDNGGEGPDLFFSPEYAGMMVTADYQRRDNNRWVFGELQQIALETTPTPLIGTLGKITLRHDPVPNSFITVRGASVRVRTLWTERGRAEAKVDLLTDMGSGTPDAPSGRYLAEAWRGVNLDTQLTKSVAWGAMP